MRNRRRTKQLECTSNKITRIDTKTIMTQSDVAYFCVRSLPVEFSMTRGGGVHLLPHITSSCILSPIGIIQCNNLFLLGAKGSHFQKLGNLLSLINASFLGENDVTLILVDERRKVNCTFCACANNVGLGAGQRTRGSLPQVAIIRSGVRD